VYFGLIDGENATVSLLLYALIYRAFVRRQDLLLGVWGALGLFKPQLFFVFPLVFMFTRRWRSLAWYAATALVLFGISFALVGAEGLQAWARILLEPESGNALANGWRMASLKSFLDALLPGLSLLSLLAYVAVSAALLLLLWQVWRRRPMDLSIAFALTCLVAVLVDPHLVDYDLTVLVAAGIVAWSLIPRYAIVILPLYLVTLLRAQIPFGEATLQLTAPLLVVLTLWIYREIPVAVAPRTESRLSPELMLTNGRRV
jgi:hypothetical protein